MNTFSMNTAKKTHFMSSRRFQRGHHHFIFGIKRDTSTLCGERKKYERVKDYSCTLKKINFLSKKIFFIQLFVFSII
jgi:hypothetical protein